MGITINPITKLIYKQRRQRASTKLDFYVPHFTSHIKEPEVRHIFNKTTDINLLKLHFMSVHQTADVYVNVLRRFTNQPTYMSTFYVCSQNHRRI